ncbi:MAG: glycoside hydrolase family 2 TIM barrel-domain containing protein, partial [Opitutales bacterium]
MKKIPLPLSVLALFAGAWLHAQAQSAQDNTTAVPATPPGARLTFPLESTWLFHRTDLPNADLSVWETVSLPHDWAMAGPFSADASSKRGGAYLPSGIAQYRKFFTLPAEDADKHVEIQFDGIQANGEVFINGHSLGQRPYGYTSVHYDLTPYLTFGPDKPNVLDVNVNNAIQPLSRYYTGSGIERHVRLVVTDPVHIQTWGLYVTTPAVSTQSATVHVETTVVNDSPESGSFSVAAMIRDADNKSAAPTVTSDAQTIAAGESATFTQDITVANPRLWDLDQPNLYQAVAGVIANGKMLDIANATFGIRSIEFKPDTGFWLNGKNIKILGVCIHEDGGAVGEAVPRSVYEERFAAMKALGANAIRMAHNPPNPVELDVCDHLGLMVMDEMFDAWTVAKANAEKGYSMYFNDWSLKDLRDAVMRDRNHPSIILWSAGNEIHDSSNNPRTRDILKGLVAAFHQYDPSRPVTQALLQPDRNNDYSNGYADTLDVIGSNYRDAYMVKSQQAVPTRKIINTEEHQDAKTWVFLRDHPQLAGCFLWAGIDYLGEGFVAKQPGVDDPGGAWPNISSGSGLVDRTLAVKGNGYQRDAWWSTQPVVHIVRTNDFVETGAGGDTPPTSVKMVDNWSPQNQYDQATVQVFSNCEQVELFLNDQSLGVKSLPADGSPREWSFPYAPGTLRAVGRNGGQDVATDTLQTAGAPAKIVLTSDRTTASPDFDDVVFVRATITDDKGVRVPLQDKSVKFTVDGPGVIVATDNGKLDDHTPFPSPERTVKDGRVLALVR